MSIYSLHWSSGPGGNSLCLQTIPVLENCHFRDRRWIERRVSCRTRYGWIWRSLLWNRWLVSYAASWLNRGEYICWSADFLNLSESHFFLTIDELWNIRLNRCGIIVELLMSTRHVSILRVDKWFNLDEKFSYFDVYWLVNDNVICFEFSI